MPISISNWATLDVLGEQPASTSRPVATFNVEMDSGHIKDMNLCRNGDEFEVRCNAAHRVEMTDDCRERILKLAVAEYRRRNP